jgi:hypothetical protein
VRRHISDYLCTGVSHRCRSYGEYLAFAPDPIDIINVGIKNLIWSGEIQSLHLIGDHHLSYIEVSVIFTPIIQI